MEVDTDSYSLYFQCSQECIWEGGDMASTGEEMERRYRRRRDSYQLEEETDWAGCGWRAMVLVKNITCSARTRLCNTKDRMKVDTY